ncbi:hypothetical protein [Planococcus lenghuensis]|nr:hypothetical protein [Planococcus lenghuensis]
MPPNRLPQWPPENPASPEEAIGHKTEAERHATDFAEVQPAVPDETKAKL